MSYRSFQPSRSSPKPWAVSGNQAHAQLKRVKEVDLSLIINQGTPGSVLRAGGDFAPPLCPALVSQK
jgi:hypothetical protein